MQQGLEEQTGGALSGNGCLDLEDRVKGKGDLDKEET